MSSHATPLLQDSIGEAKHRPVCGDGEAARVTEIWRCRLTSLNTVVARFLLRSKSHGQGHTVKVREAMLEVADDFAVTACAECSPDFEVNTVGNRPDGAISKCHVDSTAVVAPRGDQ